MLILRLLFAYPSLILRSSFGVSVYKIWEGWEDWEGWEEWADFLCVWPDWQNQQIDKLANYYYLCTFKTKTISMLTLQDTLKQHIIQAVQQLYSIDLETVELQQTRKDFTGDITLVIFPLLRHIKGNPVQIGEQIGDYLKTQAGNLVSDFNVIKGFFEPCDSRQLLHRFLKPNQRK